METLDETLRMFMRVLGPRGGHAKRCCVALVVLVIFLSGVLFLQRRLSPTG